MNKLFTTVVLALMAAGFSAFGSTITVSISQLTTGYVDGFGIVRIGFKDDGSAWVAYDPNTCSARSNGHMICSKRAAKVENIKAVAVEQKDNADLIKLNDHYSVLSSHEPLKAPMLSLLYIRDLKQADKVETYSLFPALDIRTQD